MSFTAICLTCKVPYPSIDGCTECQLKADANKGRAKREKAISDGSGDGPPAKKLKPHEGDSDSDDELLSARIARLMKLKNRGLARTKKPDDGDKEEQEPVLHRDSIARQ